MIGRYVPRAENILVLRKNRGAPRRSRAPDYPRSPRCGFRYCGVPEINFEILSGPEKIANKKVAHFFVSKVILQVHLVNGKSDMVKGKSDMVDGNWEP